MRRIILQAHRWTGVVLALYLFAVGLTGSLLVFHDEAAALSRVPRIEPAATEFANVDTIVEKLHAAFPDLHLHTIFWPEDGNSPWFAELKKGEIGYFNENAYAVYLHPSTGEILHAHNYGTSIWRAMQVIHINLAFGRSGRAANSQIALVALFSLLTGLIVWWPKLRATAAVWRVNWSARPKRLVWELHQATGIYTLLFTLTFCLTGAYFGWRTQVHKALSPIFPMHARQALRPVVSPPGLAPKAASSFLQAVHEQVPNYPVARVLFPEQSGQPIRFTVYEGSRREFYKTDNLFFDPFTGELLRADMLRDQLGGDRLANWIAIIHFGAFNFFALKLAWALLGLSLPALAVTGVVVFVAKLSPAKANRDIVAVEPATGHHTLR